MALKYWDFQNPSRSASPALLRLGLEVLNGDASPVGRRDRSWASQTLNPLAGLAVPHMSFPTWPSLEGLRKFIGLGAKLTAVRKNSLETTSGGLSFSWLFISMCDKPLNANGNGQTVLISVEPW